ncbi:MAG: helix-turn-helix domain-containing protein [Ruminococcaceae bacterium]|nr:helix-turn-helix domain-containing protein [Oscillospiraceae bacterium]
MSLSVQLYKLRTDAGLTQEKFASVIGVSRQAVQKWESGTAVPDLDNLVRIAKNFDVSLDTLVLESDHRYKEELAYEKKIQPKYTSMHGSEVYSSNLTIEFDQSMDEGKDIAAYEELFRAVSKMPTGDEKERIADVLYDIVMSAPQREGYPYIEPSELAAIRSCRPDARPGFGKPDADTLKDKIHGAWLGRICGCLLGKPVECLRTNVLVPLLKESGNYPMHRYIVSSDVTDEFCERHNARLKNRCWADTVAGMPADDDTNYMVLAHKLIEKYGLDFTPWDMSRHWLAMQPKDAYCTAERVAFCNFVKGYAPPESAVYKNPCREWIGAQIRGDYFGYIFPGDPEKAAELAWRDASISHIKNGIYGEMWASAMIAAAAVEDDIVTIIEAGLAQIPEKSRLTEAIHEIISMHAEGKSKEDCFAYIHEKWDEHSGYGWCHTISNAMVVTASLLYGGGDYGASICMAVETGFDTDCNGATVGSVIGMRGGVSAIGDEWTKPVNDLLHTTIFGMTTVKISEMAEKTWQTAIK